jgi:3-oxoacyl-[acyl-carrier protein] reductase
MIQKIKKIISSFLLPTEYISPDKKTLEKQTILITGASGGLGKAIVETLQKEGSNLILIARNKANLELAFQHLNKSKIVFMSGDITNQVEVRKIFDRIKENHKKIDVVINCAGIFSEKPLEKTSVEEFNGVLQTNLIGPFIICQQVIPIMKLSRSGLIINIGSKISHNTNLKPNKVVYSSTKYAIEGFSYALSKELKSFGIRVCS